MCGIYGFSRYQSEQEDLNLLSKMGEVQIHRGPDGEGSFCDHSWTLGMRRLSIIDIEHGQQPFYSKDKNVIVFCNGEIYNYIELRDELKKEGYIFNTLSDVEVVPYLYDKYGIECLSMLNGMFGLTIYDKKEDILYLARDRAGIKPLYYYKKDNQIIFSSEIKSILVHDIDKMLDYEALSSYIDLMFAPSPFTPFKYIRKVESGTYLKIINGSIEKCSYASEATSVVKQENIYEEIEKLLLDSAKLEVRADVEIGSFLSGGVDSTAVSVFASKFIEDKDFYAFHTHWSGAKEKIDESVYARQVADQYNMSYIEQEVFNKEMLQNIPNLIWHLEEPMSDAAFLPTFAISKIASEKIKVILSGAGGDELFGGYPRYRKRELVKRIAKSILYGKKITDSYYDFYKDNNEKQWKKLFVWYKPDNIIRKNIDDSFRSDAKSDYIQTIMDYDIKYYLQDDILLLTDKMTMATSIEARVPLLDYRLVTLSKQIPLDSKIKNGEYKLILKQILEKYVSRDILYREKEGFGAPVHSWVNKYKSEIFDNYFKDKVLVNLGLINEVEFSKLLNKEILSHKESWMYWKVLILELWMKEFYVK